MSESLTKPTLPTFSWIGHLKEDDRELLSSYGEFFPGHPGNVIIEEGVVQTEVFVVISGELEVHANREDGSRVVLARVGPGETLGEISLFHPGPATATVTATEFSQLWRIADSDLIQFMEENPGAGNVLLRTLATILAQRLRQVDPRAFSISAYGVVETRELEEQDAAHPPENVAEVESAPVASAEAVAPSTGVPVVSGVVPTSPITAVPAPAAPVVSPLLPPGIVPVTPVEREAVEPPSAPKLSRKTQAIPDPDIEPL